MAYNTAATPVPTKLPGARVLPPLAAKLDILLKLEPTDQFWQDAYFDSRNDRWATDPNMKAAIEWHLQYERALEEVLRIGWEVWRVCAWLYARYRLLPDTRQRWVSTGGSPQAEGEQGSCFLPSLASLFS